MKPVKKQYDREVKVQFRSTPEEKAYLERAAANCGFKNLSEFLRVSAHEKARKEFPELASSYNRTLSKHDSLLIADALLNPPEPNEKLKQLFSKRNLERQEK